MLKLEPQESELNPQLSDQYKNFKVRWVGFVDGTEGDWLGVEWDREGRGKHDGTHKGSTYFQPVRSVRTSETFDFKFNLID